MTQPWEPWVAAAFAPAAVWLLWRLQTLSVELLRWRLLKLVTWRGTRWLYAVVSWFGTFLHEASHASVLLLSGHGIREFRSGVEEGHVTPMRLRRGPLSFLFFLAAALAPLFIPPLLVLLGVLFLADRNVLPLAAAGAGLQDAVGVLRQEFVAFPVNLARDLASLDLSKWPQLCVFLLALFGLPASRPSHVKGSRFHGTESEGDVPVLRRRIRQQPILFLLFLAALYGAHLLVGPLPAAFYWYPFEWLWAVALTGTLLCVLGAAWWSLVALSRRTWRVLSWVGPALFVALQVALRAPGLSLPGGALEINGVALAAWAAAAAVLALAAPRRT